MALQKAPEWQALLEYEFDQPYMQQLKAFLQQQKAQHKVIYPHSSNWFHALETTPLSQVKVVILGQDPYHQPDQGKGWEQFTDRVISLVNKQRDHVVFMLWGSYAQKKGAAIDGQRHLVLKAPHPSPLSAHRGFLGCKHFSRANEYLQQHGQTPIDWQLPASVKLSSD